MLLLLPLLLPLQLLLYYYYYFICMTSSCSVRLRVAGDICDQLHVSDWSAYYSRYQHRVLPLRHDGLHSVGYRNHGRGRVTSSHPSRKYYMYIEHVANAICWTIKRSCLKRDNKRGFCVSRTRTMAPPIVLIFNVYLSFINTDH